jgi:hypothetical protein
MVAVAVTRYGPTPTSVPSLQCWCRVGRSANAGETCGCREHQRAGTKPVRATQIPNGGKFNRRLPVNQDDSAALAHVNQPRPSTESSIVSVVTTQVPSAQSIRMRDGKVPWKTAGLAAFRTVAGVFDERGHPRRWGWRPYGDRGGRGVGAKNCANGRGKQRCGARTSYHGPFHASSGRVPAISGTLAA